MRAILLAALPLLALASACKKEPEPQPTPTASAQASTAGGIEAGSGLVASAGKLLLPPVSGRPGAAYFTLANGGDTAVTVTAVSVAGAETAEMHETVGGAMKPLATIAVKPGETVRFERGGKHVMAFGLAPSVAAGGTAELTLTLAGGDTLVVPLAVEAMAGPSAGRATPAAKGPNEGGGTMSGMDMGHGDPH